MEEKLEKNMITFIGDLHGKIAECKKIVDAITNSNFLCVGDFSYGFRDHHTGELNDAKSLGPRFRTLCGNHDAHEHAKNDPAYLGRYGITPEGIFFVSGAYSIDWQSRNTSPPYTDWWPDEQLSYVEFEEALDLYKKTKPTIVVSHDCPISIYYHLHLGQEIINNLTAIALEKMREFHKPKIHCFGHHHLSFDKVIDGTRFICLDELETVNIEF